MTGHCCAKKNRGYPAARSCRSAVHPAAQPSTGSRQWNSLPRGMIRRFISPDPGPSPPRRCEVSVIGAGFIGLNASRKLRRNGCRVKCRSGRFFQKYLLPEGHLSMTPRKQNSQTGWKNGATLPDDGQAPADSDRQGFVSSESSPRKGNGVRFTDRISARGRQYEQNPSFAAPSCYAPRWPNDGRRGEALLLKGR